MSTLIAIKNLNNQISEFIRKNSIIYKTIFKKAHWDNFKSIKEYLVQKFTYFKCCNSTKKNNVFIIFSKMNHKFPHNKL